MIRYFYTFQVKWSEVTQSCLTLCDPMDCSLQGSSVHGIFQARIQEWVVISFSRGSSQARDRTWVACIAGRRFTIWAPGKHFKMITKISLVTVSLKILNSYCQYFPHCAFYAHALFSLKLEVCTSYFKNYSLLFK